MTEHDDERTVLDALNDASEANAPDRRDFQYYALKAVVWAILCLAHAIEAKQPERRWHT